MGQKHPHQTLLLIIAIITSLYLVPPAAAAPAQIGELTRIEFDELKASAHMTELEERMYRLSELLREHEPEHAARLLMGLEKSRQELIIDRMRHVRQLLSNKSLDDAITQQQQVKVKLEQLRDLLMSTDLDLLLKLEQLRKLNEALKKLDKIIAEQNRQKQLAEALDAQQKRNAPPPPPARFRQARDDQKRNRTATDALRAAVNRIVSRQSTAPGDLANAATAMAAAGNQLANQQPAPAADQQRRALDQLQKARQAIAQQRQELLDQLRDQVRAMVITALADMLKQQTQIRKATAAISAKLAVADRQALLAVKRLAAAEQAIADSADQIIRLIEQTEFGIALPLAIRAVQRQISTVASDLNANRGDQQVVAAEKQIEKDLADLLAMLKEQASRAAQQAGQPSQCKLCQDSNKLLAELKMIRMLQVKVNRTTTKTDSRRPQTPQTPLTRQLQAALQTLYHRQSEITDATDTIHHRVCASCRQSQPQEISP